MTAPEAPRSAFALLAIALAAGAACADAGHSTPGLGAATGDDHGSDGGYAASAAPQPINTTLIRDEALCTPGPVVVDWSPVRRISRVEYDNMVRDLLGDTTRPATAFVPESPMVAGVNFATNTYTSVSSLIVQQYQRAAETLAQAAVADTSRLNDVVLPCHTQDDACATQFIGSFASRAFRGQLDATETAGLLQLYTDAKTAFDFATGIQAIIAAVLESPRFLYVLEFGQSADGVTAALTPIELAARLALFLWRSVPDDALLKAAAGGELDTPDGVEIQARRMLSDTTKAKAALDDFTTQWMQLQATAALGKDAQFRTWAQSPKLGAEMRDEVLTNVSQAVLAEREGLGELLTSSSSYVNAELAAFYKVPLGAGMAVTVADPAIGGPASFVKTDLTAAGHAGILTNGGVLATQAHTSLPSSVLRGKLVREQLLCNEIPPPPPNVPPPPAHVADAGTTRGLFEAHATTPGCVICHQYMDPIGFAFGHFDATGSFQTLDANGFGTGPAIDATGQVIAARPAEFAATFDGAPDLATKLAGAAQVQQCFALDELRYALGRIETRADACSAQQIYGAFTASRLNLQRLLVAIVRSDTFRSRSAVHAGSACR